MPDPSWKRATSRTTRTRQPGGRARPLSYGIGQGSWTVNALQLAVMTARLANGKKALQPAADQVGRRRGAARRARTSPTCRSRRSTWSTCAPAWRR